jgi:DNA-binding CsgD family transcriptional regulator
LLRVAGDDAKLAAITTRERETVRLMARGRSLSEIASLINVSYKTVASSCALLRSKLNARTPMELVRIAVLMGLC